MDIDISEDIPQTSSSTARKLVVPVDDAHPFDLDAYISNYTGIVKHPHYHCIAYTFRTGRTAVDRLIHIIAICPSIAVQTFHVAVQYIHQLRDPNLYQTALTALEQSLGQQAENIPDDVLDPKWIDDVVARNQAERLKLDVELKTYSNNMIKESIRVSGTVP
jgi:COP9 signalosome complex subunit 1